MKEIERKWLIEPVEHKLLTNYQSAYFVQGYLIVGGGEFRIRTAGFSGFMAAVKIGAGLTREEFEFPVDADVGHDMLNHAISSGWYLSKRRWHLPSGLEIDQFADRHAGLWLAEKEFASEDEANAFEAEMPRFVQVIKEVTLDPAYKNAALATSPRAPR